MTQFIGIEGGGTKFVCAYGSGPNDLHERTVIKTQSPDKTMPEIIEYIRGVRLKADIKAIGVSIFGPLDLNKMSSTYGWVMPAASKVAWSNFNFVGTLKQHFNLPVGFDTDVNGAAIAEYRWGAAQGLDNFLYLTIGTGIGGGAISNGRLLHGAMHPEMGHIFVPQDPNDSFEGVCSCHKNCLEGLASGPAMKTRWKVNSALDLPEDHVAWDLEAHYLGLALASYSLILSPKRIVLGGGVMRQNHLLLKIHKKMLEFLNGYIDNPDVLSDRYIIKPGVGENSGVLGSIALAEVSYLEENSQ